MCRTVCVSPAPLRLQGARDQSPRLHLSVPTYEGELRDGDYRECKRVASGYAEGASGHGASHSCLWFLATRILHE